MKAKKNDHNKAPLDFLRMDGVAEMCQVFEFGAKKYGRNNYLRGHEQTRLLAAALRHLLAYQQGEDCDPESHLSHLAHAQCNLAMLQTQKALGTSIDDRGGDDQNDFESQTARIIIEELPGLNQQLSTAWSDDVCTPEGADTTILQDIECKDCEQVLEVGCWYRLNNGAQEYCSGQAPDGHFCVGGRTYLPDGRYAITARWEDPLTISHKTLPPEVTR